MERQSYKHSCTGRSRLYSSVIHCFPWPIYIQWLNDSCMSKDIMYGDLGNGHCPGGCCVLHFKDICKKNLKATDIDPHSLEQLADAHSGWHHCVQKKNHEGWEKAKTAGGQKTMLTEQCQTLYIPASSAILAEEPAIQRLNCLQKDWIFTKQGTPIILWDK